MGVAVTTMAVGMPTVVMAGSAAIAGAAAIPVTTA